LVVLWNGVSISNRIRDIALKAYWGHELWFIRLYGYILLYGLTFHGHLTSSVTWPFESPHAVSYWWSFGTETLNPAVFEILHSKCIGVTSFTFQGHVTSSVTW